MVKINNDEITMNGDLHDIMIEMFVGVFGIKKEILQYGSKDMVDFFDNELQKVAECKSLKELEELPNND